MGMTPMLFSIEPLSVRVRRGYRFKSPALFVLCMLLTVTGALTAHKPERTWNLLHRNTDREEGPSERTLPVIRICGAVLFVTGMALVLVDLFLIKE